MLLSAFKSEKEIAYCLEGMKRVAVFSCNICANLNGTGGPGGLKVMRRVLKRLDKTVVLSKSVNVCCSEEILAQTFRIFLQPVQAECDALVMLSCASGVKTAFLCQPGIPVIAALDSMGSGAITRREDPVASSRCVACGHCVLSCTGGICPVSGCFANRKYGPCKRYGEKGDRCAYRDEQPCVWMEIEKRGGDLTVCKEIEKVHQESEAGRIPPCQTKTTPASLRKFSGWFMARIPSLSRLIRMVD